MRELEKIKRERAEHRAKEVPRIPLSFQRMVTHLTLQQEAEKAAKEQDEREREIALGNPLLNAKKNFSVKRRWDDDVVFKNQARGTEDKRRPEFVNDLLRSDFHKKFMVSSPYPNDDICAREGVTDPMQSKYIR